MRFKESCPNPAMNGETVAKQNEPAPRPTPPPGKEAALPHATIATAQSDICLCYSVTGAVTAVSLEGLAAV